MSDKLEMPVEQFAEAVSKENARLNKCIEKLEAALRPFAEKYLWPDDSGFADEIRSDEDWDKQKNDQQVDDMWIERGWIRAAREALEQTNG